MTGELPLSVPHRTLTPKLRAVSRTLQALSALRRIRSSSSSLRPFSLPMDRASNRKVMVGMTRTPASATEYSSASVARSACIIQSTPASAAALVEPAPREWMVTRALRRWASSTTAAISCLDMVWSSPQVLSASLMKSTPCLVCRRTSVIMSLTSLARTPRTCSGVPTHDGS